MPLLTVVLIVGKFTVGEAFRLFITVTKYTAPAVRVTGLLNVNFVQVFAAVHVAVVVCTTVVLGRVVDVNPRISQVIGPGVPALPTSAQGIAGMFGGGGLSMGTPDPFAAQMTAQNQQREQARKDEEEAAQTRRVALLSGVGSMFG